MLKLEDIHFEDSSPIDDFYSPVSAPSFAQDKIKIASTSDLKGFVRVASDKLVRISQNDFWKLAKDEETGEFFIERIADDMDGPVKG